MMSFLRLAMMRAVSAMRLMRICLPVMPIYQGFKTVTTFLHSSKKKALESDYRLSSMARGMTVYRREIITIHINIIFN